MKSGLRFLVAARRCEIGELEHLALTGTLVKVFTEFSPPLYGPQLGG